MRTKRQFRRVIPATWLLIVSVAVFARPVSLPDKATNGTATVDSIGGAASYLPGMRSARLLAKSSAIATEGATKSIYTFDFLNRMIPVLLP